MRFALLNGDTVDNIVIAADDYQHAVLETIALGEYQYCEIGYYYDRVTQTFTPPIDPAALESAKSEKQLELQQGATAEIESGFSSDALGSLHYYNSKLINQINLVMHLDKLRRHSGWVDWSCTDLQTGVKDARPHSLTQLEQVLDDSVTANTQTRAKYRTLVNQVLQATTIDAVTAIVWY